MYDMDMAGWIEEEPEELRGLLRELHWVRYRGIWGLRRNRAPIPRLVEIAAILFPRISRQSQYQLMAALFKTKLPPLLPEDYQRAIPGYFWLRNEPTMESPKIRRTTVGQAIFFQSWSRLRDWNVGYERPFLVRIAKASYQLAETALSRETSASVNEVQSRPYIRRDTIHSEIAKLLERGEKLIVLEGPVGTGKSRLAWELAIEHANPSEITTLSLPRTGTSITNAATDVSFASRDVSTSLERAAIGENAPVFLILETFGKRDDLLATLPELTGTTIIVTTQRAQPMARGSVVYVGPLNISEATQMVLSRLPSDINTEDARRLAKSLGRNARAIEQGCEIMSQNPDLTLQEFRRALDHYTTQVLATSGNDDQVPLPVIYREIYMNLTQVYPVAAELLENMAFAFAENEYASLDFMEVCMRRSSQLAAEYPAMGRVVFLNACRVLAKWHLIDLAPDCLRINELTQAILRDLLRESAEVVCNRLLDSIGQWEAGLRGNAEQFSTVPVLQEMAIHGVTRQVYAQEYWIKMIRNSLYPTPTYERELNEMEDRRRELLEREVSLGLRLSDWMLNNIAVNSTDDSPD